jgi:hypothetical protein
MRLPILEFACHDFICSRARKAIGVDKIVTLRASARFAATRSSTCFSCKTHDSRRDLFQVAPQRDGFDGSKRLVIVLKAAKGGVSKDVDVENGFQQTVRESGSPSNTHAPNGKTTH